MAEVRTNPLPPGRRLDDKIRSAVSRCARDLSDVILRGVRERVAEMRIEAALKPLAPEARTRVVRAAIVLHGFERPKRAEASIAPLAKMIRAPRRCVVCKSPDHDRRTCPERRREAYASRLVAGPA